MTLAEHQAQLVEDLLIIPDVQERLGVVAGRAGSRSLPQELKTDEHLVRGCVSRVWVVAELQDGRCVFRSDAESPMVKGLVALLCDAYSGGTPQEVIAQEPALWQQLGFHKQLTPTRLNGLAAVHARIVAFAQAQLGA